ncbi:MAPEG family protein [Sphingosinicella sp.]|uniref:MAPEG family protein n=1 Tax=Sphingosinicella sp. TaxID=1917971 RepID=UPI0040384BF5
MNAAIIAPVVALVAWTLLMQIWLYAVRFPAMRRAGLSMKGRVGSKTGSLDGVVEDHVQWKAHNYNHLLEQPTLFYAIALSLALLGGGNIWINVWLAWAYVAFRILHSLIQATVNVVKWRFLAFIAASLCLLGLTVHAAARILHG